MKKDGINCMPPLPYNTGVPAQSLSHVWLFVTLWTVACQAPLSRGLPRLPTQGLFHVSYISCIGRRIIYSWATRETLKIIKLYSSFQLCLKTIHGHFIYGVLTLGLNIQWPCSHVSMYQLCVALSLQSCPTLCDPVDFSPPDFSVHRILQARILEWVAMLSSRGSSQPRGWTHVVLMSPALGGSFFPLTLPEMSADLPHSGIKPESPALQVDS